MCQLNFMKRLLMLLLCIAFLTCKQKVVPTKQHELKLEIIKNFKLRGFKISDTILNKWSNRLVQVYYNDQFYRDLNNPEYAKQNFQKQLVLDLENQKIVAEFLDGIGYKSPSEIGAFAQFGVNLTLIHAGKEFKNKYKNAIDKAFKEKKIRPAFYAMFTDKYLAQVRKFQKYGTQVTYFKGTPTLYPIDPSNVNINRKSIGLTENISDYLKNNFNAPFDSIEYIRILPELIQHYKVDTTRNNL